MSAWLKANGGPLAVVVVGVTVGGFTNRIAGLALILAGLAALAFAAVRHRRTARLSQASVASRCLPEGQLLVGSIATAGFDNLNAEKVRAYRWIAKTHDALLDAGGLEQARYFVDVTPDALTAEGRSRFMADNQNGVLRRLREHLKRLEYGPPPHAPDIDLLGDRQTAYIHALLRERESARDVEHVHAIDDQIEKARDSWWEWPQELASVIQEGEDLRRRHFDPFGLRGPPPVMLSPIATQIVLWKAKAFKVVRGGFPECVNLFHDNEPFAAIDEPNLRDHLDARLAELLRIQERLTS